MKKLFILVIMICVSTLSFSQGQPTNKSVSKKTNAEVVLNQQVENLNSRIDSISTVHQLAIDKIANETKSNCSTYYDRLDNELDRTLTKFSCIWGLLGVLIGLVLPLVINRVYERSIKEEITDLKTFVNQQIKNQDRITASRLREQYKEIEKQIKEQNKTFGKRFAEHKAYIDNVSAEVENYEKSSKINSLLTKVQSIYKNSPEEAINLCSEILLLDRQNPYALLLRGIAYMLSSKYQEALTDLKNAASIDPTLAKAYNNIGNVYASTGLIEEALENYNQALKINPNYEIVHRNIALIYLDKNIDFTKAEYHLTKAIEIDPRYFNAYVTRSSLYRKMAMKETDASKKAQLQEKALSDTKIAQKLKDNDSQK